MATINVIKSASGIQLKPARPSSRMVISATKAPIMKMSPCAKLIMPMLPETLG